MLKGFFGAFLGKLAAACFIALCIIFGFGPDQWVIWMLADLPKYITPELARVVFIFLGGSTLLALLWRPVVNRLKGENADGEQTELNTSASHHLPGSVVDAFIFPDELMPSSINGCSPLQTIRDQHTNEDLPFLAFDAAIEEACQGQHRFLVINADRYMRFRVKWSAKEIGHVVFELYIFRVNRPPIPIVKIVDTNGHPNLPVWTEWGGPVKLPSDCQETFLIKRKIADKQDTLVTNARLHQIHMTAG